MRSWSLDSSGPLGSHALLVSCPHEHLSRKEHWAAVSFHVFPRQRESFPRMDNVEITDFKPQEKQHTHRLGDLPLARSWSLALRARWSPRTDTHLFLFWLPTVPAVSSERRFTLLVSCPSGACLNRSLLRAVSRWVPCCHCSAISLECRAAICIRCRCLTRLVFAIVITSSFGNTKGKLLPKLKKVTVNISSTFCVLQGSRDNVCGFSTSSTLVSHVHLRPHGGPRVNQSRSAAPGNGCGR